MKSSRNQSRINICSYFYQNALKLEVTDVKYGYGFFNEKDKKNFTFYTMRKSYSYRPRDNDLTPAEQASDWGEVLFPTMMCTLNTHHSHKVVMPTRNRKGIGYKPIVIMFSTELNSIVDRESIRCRMNLRVFRRENTCITLRG